MLSRNDEYVATIEEIEKSEPWNGRRLLHALCEDRPLDERRRSRKRDSRLHAVLRGEAYR